jgi:hypothetical protein
VIDVTKAGRTSDAVTFLSDDGDPVGDLQMAQASLFQHLERRYFAEI